MRFAVVMVAALTTLWLGLASAQAGKRLALVIGNSSYQKVPVLPNPGRGMRPRWANCSGGRNLAASM